MSTGRLHQRPDEVDDVRYQMDANHAGRLLSPSGQHSESPSTSELACGSLLLHAAFASRPEMVSVARDSIAGCLERAGLRDRIATARLLTSELVTNALLHARGTDITVTVRYRSDGVLFIAVADPSPQLPTRRHAAADDETGRGMTLINALAHHWGATHTGQGTKYIWCTLRGGDLL
ncbi:ATP-binding protein [Streptomyces sp. T-3]|nr:ATP-binding protein [Streptomyces sp. T-3]